MSQGGDRTEKATPKKRRDAREKGQVFKSQDLIVALSMAVLLGALMLLGPNMVEGLKKLMVGCFTSLDRSNVGIEALALFLEENIWQYLKIMLPIFGAAFLAALVFNLLQVGFLFAPKAISPKFSRISPIEGFKRIFSVRTVVELVKSIVKIAALAVIAYGEYQKQIQNAQNLLSMGVTPAVSWTADMLLSVGFKLVLALCIMAPLDFLFQWWKHEKDLMMTKQEVKDEYKLVEGNPEIKGRIKQKQRQMASQRMMAAVATADVVITNPTHYAVALKYDESTHAAPVIVAKGQDFVAQKIKERARENGVELVENKPLAQHLYFFCDIGDEVPEEMYQAVAEVLAYIYRLKHANRR